MSAIIPRGMFDFFRVTCGEVYDRFSRGENRLSAESFDRQGLCLFFVISYHRNTVIGEEFFDGGIVYYKEIVVAFAAFYAECIIGFARNGAHTVVIISLEYDFFYTVKRKAAVFLTEALENDLVFLLVVIKAVVYHSDKIRCHGDLQEYGKGNND